MKVIIGLMYERCQWENILKDMFVCLFVGIKKMVSLNYKAGPEFN